MSATEIDDRVLPEPSLPEQGTNTLSAFQRKRRELARAGAREIHKLVPLWKGALRIQYRYPEAGADPIIAAFERALEAAEKAKKTGKHGQGTFNANADVLIACVHDIEFRDIENGGDWAPLDDDGPLGFTSRLATKLELDVPDTIKSKARFILRHLFSPNAETTGQFEGDLTLLDQAGEVLMWLKATDEALDGELAGE